MSASDAAPLPRLGEVFFDVRGNSRSMRLSWYADTGVAVFSIWQGGMCTGTFRLAIADLPRMVETLRRGPGGQAAAGGPGALGEQFTAVPVPANAEVPAQGADYGTGPAEYAEDYQGRTAEYPAERSGHGTGPADYPAEPAGFRTGPAGYPAEHQTPAAEYPAERPSPAGYPAERPGPAGYPAERPGPAGYPAEHQTPAAEYPGHRTGPADYPAEPGGYRTVAAEYPGDYQTRAAGYPAEPASPADYPPEPAEYRTATAGYSEDYQTRAGYPAERPGHHAGPAGYPPEPSGYRTGPADYSAATGGHRGEPAAYAAEPGGHHEARADYQTRAAEYPASHSGYQDQAAGYPDDQLGPRGGREYLPGHRGYQPEPEEQGREYLAELVGGPHRASGGGHSSESFEHEAGYAGGTGALDYRDPVPAAHYRRDSSARGYGDATGPTPADYRAHYGTEVTDASPDDLPAESFRHGQPAGNRAAARRHAPPEAPFG
jgi:hypothetical protein